MRYILAILTIVLSIAAASACSKLDSHGEISDSYLVVNTDSLTLGGFAPEKFYKFYAGKYSSNVDYPRYAVEGFCDALKAKLSQALMSFKGRHLMFYYQLDYITDKGGFGGRYTVWHEGQLLFQDRFMQQDGRWNKLDVLLDENLRMFIFGHKQNVTTKVTINLLKKKQNN